MMPIYKKYPYTHSYIDWKPLSERRREQRLIIMYKIVNDLIAIPAETHITLNRELQDHQLLTS